MQQRIGIDVGGTNTDAVLMSGRDVVAWVKTATTADVTTGIVHALQDLLLQARVRPEGIRGVMIGTTHFTNAVVQRRDLSPVAAIRLALPATVCLPPLIDWPDALRDLVGQAIYMLPGGQEIDGRMIAPFEDAALLQVLQDIRAREITDIAVTSVFSPTDASLEQRAAALIQRTLPAATITLSSARIRARQVQQQAR